VSQIRFNTGDIKKIYLSSDKNSTNRPKIKGDRKIIMFRSINNNRRKANEYVQDISHFMNSMPEYDEYQTSSILNKFSDQLAKIPEVKRVLYSIEEGDLDIYIFFDSSNLSVRFDIYKQSQVIISEAFAYGINVDLHATNLVDFDANQINSLIPSDANSLINR
jgi:hypothetical protein